MWKGIALTVCVFTLWLIIFTNATSDSGMVFFGSVAATVLTVFIYGKIAKKVGV